MTELLPMLRFPASSSLLKFTSYFFKRAKKFLMLCKNLSECALLYYFCNRMCYLDKGANSHSDLETTYKNLHLANSQALQNWGEGMTCIDRWLQWFPSAPTGPLCYKVVLSTEVDLTAIPWHYFRTPPHLLPPVTEYSLSWPARGNTKDRNIFPLFASSAWFQIYRLAYRSIS